MLLLEDSSLGAFIPADEGRATGGEPGLTPVSAGLGGRSTDPPFLPVGERDTAALHRVIW